MGKIDINCDVGEGLGNESEIMPFIRSCNIACGGHAGTDTSMREIVLLASKHMVKIGAHPGYPDKENFGRRHINIDPSDLINSLKEQVKGLEVILKKHNIDLHHIKAHGALYNELFFSEALCSSYLLAVETYKKRVKLFLPYGSLIAKMAVDHGFNVVYEGFADRNYNEDLTLVSRESQNAMIVNSDEVLRHVKEMVNEMVLTTLEGKKVHIEVETICVHSDTNNAVEILKYLYNNFN